MNWPLAGLRPARSGRRLYYGWIIAFLAGLGVYLSGPGQTYSVSVFINHFIADFGWSRSLVSSLYSAGTLTAGLTMTLVGRLVDRRGYRLTMTGVALSFAGALLFMSTINTPVALFAGFFLIRTLGQGSLTLIPYSMVPQWFITRRARALSFLAVGGALGAATIPHINLFLIQAVGWRGGFVFWAGVLGLILAPLAWRLARDRPEDMGLLPDGELASRPTDDGASPAPEEDAWTAAEVVRIPVFWILLLSTSVPSLVGTGTIFHHLSIMEDAGVSAQAAAAVFTVASAVMLMVTPISGMIIDRLPARYVLSLTLTAEAVQLVILLYTRSTAMALVLGAFHGIRMSFLVVIGGLIWPHFFGRRYLASIRGITTTLMVIFSALGPLPLGLAYDYFGGYHEIILMMMVLPVAAGIAILFIRRPERTARTGERGAARAL